MNERMWEWVNGWISEWMSERINDWVIKWVNNRNDCAWKNNERTNECVSGWKYE